MKKNSFVRTFGLPLAACGAMLALQAADAAVLIVRSTGPSATGLKPGKTLPDNGKVQLKPGDSLTVLATDSTRTFHGPGTFALASNGGGAPAMAAGRRGRFSALRTAGIIPRSPTLWHVDVSQSGKVCVADKDNLWMWRPDASKTAMLTIHGANGRTDTVEWPAGQSVLAWPSDIPVVANGQYELTVAGQASPTKMSFAPLSSVPTDLPSVATALIDNQCESQLDLLIQTVPEAAPSKS